MRISTEKKNSNEVCPTKKEICQKLVDNQSPIFCGKMKNQLVQNLNLERCESIRKNLVDLEKPEKNEYLSANFGVDTAEKEPSKVCLTLSLFRLYLVRRPWISSAPAGRGRWTGASSSRPARRLYRAPRKPAARPRRGRSDKIFV